MLVALDGSSCPLDRIFLEDCLWFRPAAFSESWPCLSVLVPFVAFAVPTLGKALLRANGLFAGHNGWMDTPLLAWVASNKTLPFLFAHFFFAFLILGRRQLASVSTCPVLAT